MSSKKLNKMLPALKGWRESAFILCLSERALPNALLFFSLNNSASLEGLMGSLWSRLIESPSEDGIVLLLDQTEQLKPDMESDDSFGARAAAACLNLMEQALLAGLNQDKRRAEEAAAWSLQLVTEFVEFSEGEEMTENELVALFDKHPLVKREISFQEELADMLRSASKPSASTLTLLRELASDEGVSNIGISLDD